MKHCLQSLTMISLACCTHSTFSQDTQGALKPSTIVSGSSIADEHGSVTAKTGEEQSKLQDGYSVMISFVTPDGSGYCRLEAGKKLIPFKEESERDGTAVKQRNADPGDWRITTLYRLSNGKEQGVWVKESLLPEGLSLILKGDTLKASYRDPKLPLDDVDNCKIIAVTTLPELANVKPDKYVFGKTFKPEIALKIVRFIDEAKKQIPEHGKK